MFNRITVIPPAGAESLLFWKLNGTEVMSRSFTLNVTMLSQDENIDRKALLGKSLTVFVPTQSLQPRYFNGKITEVNLQGTELNGIRYAVYLFKIESDLWPLLRNRDQRIFQNQRVPDIVKTILSEYDVQVEDKLTGEYRNWEYCVQYQESSYEFISRLMELEGIYFFFRHDAESHTLVLMDSAVSHQPFNGYEVIPYHISPSGGTTSEEGIGKWAISERVMPGLYSIDDYDFRKPHAWMFQARQNPASPSPGQIDYYEWPGRFVDQQHGEFYARIRQEEWQAEQQRVDASGTALGIAPGYTFTLSAPPYKANSNEYLVVSADYTFEENSYASGSVTDSIHKINFAVIPADINFRSQQRTEWPRTHGPQTARVVGPVGETIWTDRYGRVKVKFHWDRHAKGDDTSSCWVRVSSAWAGQGFGGVQVPRVGDEVVIDFINGDPDRPIITGRVYNEASMPPWELPAAATVMGFMTRSKDGNKDNASHLFFEDNPGYELVDLHSEKDMKVSVENDQNVSIDGNRNTAIKKEQNDNISGDATFHYHQKRTTTVDNIETKNFNNGEHTTIQKGRTLKVLDGGDTVEVTSYRDTTINGRESHHVTGKLTETYNQGLNTTIDSGGKVETINDGVLVNINSGNWTQNVNDGTITIYSPHDITLRSTTKINLDAPNIKSKAKAHNESFTGNSFSVTGFSESFTGASFGFTTSTISTSVMSVSVGAFSIKNKPFELKRHDNKIQFVSGTETTLSSFRSFLSALTTFV
ncbi:type VI secretion system tip protein TssI/VgrG [Pantoea allii]|uniref:type VI secretion system Vgr family protein n=1 Tax=Pantoea TaxID=53335 RepID=UPI0021176BDA|nr:MULTISPECIES: type VI secretion system tip protein TssI/VgrG [Pantoea]MDJ0087413.1 type VI secretion system tip protein TssI/VgrG [Pantoea allii]